MAVSYASLAVFVFLTVELWVMDAHYLRLERAFRQHHRAIVNGMPPLDMWEFDVSRFLQRGILRTMFDFFSLWIYPAVLLAVGIMADVGMGLWR